MGRWILKLGGLGVFAYIGACLAIWFGQPRLIFHPQMGLALTPADLDLPYEDVWIPVDEGQIHGWWIPANAPNAKTVLYLHGNAGNIETNVWRARYLSQLGLSVLLIDYRGYGLSSGPFPNETRVYEDTNAAWDYLTQNRKITPQNIVIFGHSIGGAIAINLAHQYPQAGGLIVESTFTSMADMVDLTIYGQVFPKWLLHQTFPSQQKLPELKMPVLLIHGLDDNTIPATMSEQLYAEVPDPKQLWLVPGANHNNVAEVAGPEYREVLQQWLSSR
ncbi:MAG: alpha/beta fold hydrolase [Cyanobacteria bacterium J06626_18]